MGDLASVDDLEKLMGRTFTDTGLDQAEMVVSAVSAWARAVSGQEWPGAVPSDVKYVVLAASRRTLRNPDGVTSESMGPFSKSYDKAPVNFFTQAELAILKRYRVRSTRGGLFTIGFTRGEEGNPQAPGYLWLDDELSDSNLMPVFWPGDPNFEESVHLDD